MKIQGIVSSIRLPHAPPVRFTFQLIKVTRGILRRTLFLTISLVSPLAVMETRLLWANLAMCTFLLFPQDFCRGLQ